MKVGPLAMKDDLEYRREVHLHDEIRATMVLRGLAGDVSRIVWRNDFYRRDVLATRVHTLSAWLDLTQRKLVAPPAGVVEALSLDPPMGRVGMS